MKILIIDSHLLYLQTLKALFEDGETEIEISDQIELGWKNAITHQYDLIFVDISLPKKVGWRISQQLKTDLRTREIPLVVLSSDSKDKKVAEEFGTEAFILKPCQYEEIKETIDRFRVKVEEGQKKRNEPIKIG